MLKLLTRRRAATGRGPVAVVSATVPYSVQAFYTGLCDELAERGYDVHVVTAPGARWEELSESVDALHILPMQRGISPHSDLLALMRWVRLLAGLRPELVIAGTPKASLLAMVAARILRVPRRTYHLLGLRGETASGCTARILAAVERLTSSCATTVLAVSPSLAAEYSRLGLAGTTPVRVLGSGSTHGVNADHFAPRPRDGALATRVGLDLARPVLVFVGRLTRDKGVDTLIEALRRVRQEEPETQLLIIGSQDEADSERYVQQLHGLPGVVLVDDQADVRPFMALGDVLLLPTWREGMPNVVLEAGAMEVPAITTTATGAVDSVVDGQTGYVVGVGDSDAMARRALQLIRSPEERSRLGPQARQRAIVEFSPVQVHQQIADAITG